ncbi:unnamed protein product [Bursaphelenchus okinawaensis]|uniref:Uncharacterized protein n=1 Tax=Bursaphelenchus okinawaensis TaxID=465554 RepID=A0A811L5J2_9BILA|nr:unnamed protein product [Bursaphelenchus okinawaensis]CAG9117050.1 unnamed protein product [Bursaphelenchus okinawaensis]
MRVTWLVVVLFALASASDDDQGVCTAPTPSCTEDPIDNELERPVSYEHAHVVAKDLENVEEDELDNEVENKVNIGEDQLETDVEDEDRGNLEEDICYKMENDCTTFHASFKHSEVPKEWHITLALPEFPLDEPGCHNEVTAFTTRFKCSSVSKSAQFYSVHRYEASLCDQIDAFLKQGIFSKESVITVIQSSMTKDCNLMVKLKQFKIQKEQLLVLTTNGAAEEDLLKAFLNSENVLDLDKFENEDSKVVNTIRKLGEMDKFFEPVLYTEWLRYAFSPSTLAISYWCFCFSIVIVICIAVYRVIEVVCDRSDENDEADDSDGDEEGAPSIDFSKKED